MKRIVAFILIVSCMSWVVGCKANPTAKEESALLKKHEIVQAAYPELAVCPDEADYIKKNEDFDEDGFNKAYAEWTQSRDAQRNQPEGYADNLTTFFDKSISQYLASADGKNAVYSPVNLYMALTMLAEITDGESRQQILDLLGAADLETLRGQAASVWNSHYSDDGSVTSVLANSLWLNKNVNFVQETMENLAKYEYASAFQGEMGSTELNQAMQEWVNAQTGGLLEDQASELSMTPDTIMALISTIYYRVQWASEFDSSATQQDDFYLNGSKDQKISCDFMKKIGPDNYYWGDQFTAVALNTEGDGRVWLILPNEGVSIDALLADQQTMDFLHADGKWDQIKYATVNMSVPKFDVASDIDLRGGLQQLGIQDVFSAEKSDFTPMSTETEGVFVSQAEQAARVAVDEKGIVAAAYTLISTRESMMPPEEEVEFKLNRPFLFAIMSHDGLPLFTGVVNQPVE